MQISDQAIISPRIDVTSLRPTAVFSSHATGIYSRLQSTPVHPHGSLRSSNQPTCLQGLAGAFISTQLWAAVTGDCACPTSLFLTAQAARGLFSRLVTGNSCILGSQTCFVLFSTRETEFLLSYEDKNHLFLQMFQCHLFLPSLFQGQMVTASLSCPQQTEAFKASGFPCLFLSCLLI